MPKIFISYRRADSAYAAGRMFDRLVHSFGPGNVFKDVDNIPPGADFARVIERRLQNCDVVIVVIGKDWLAEKDADGNPRLHNPADWVRMEIDHALSVELRVIPALVEGASMPSPLQLPPSLQPLSTRNAVMIRSDPDFHRDMDRLIDALKEHMAWKKESGHDAIEVVPVSAAPKPPSARGTPYESERGPGSVKKPAPADQTTLIIGIVVALAVGVPVVILCCLGVLGAVAGP